MQNDFVLLAVTLAAVVGFYIVLRRFFQRLRTIETARWGAKAGLSRLDKWFLNRQMRATVEPAAAPAPKARQP